MRKYNCLTTVFIVQNKRSHLSFQVLGQVDNKFIACSLQANGKNFEPINIEINKRKIQFSSHEKLTQKCTKAKLLRTNR